MKNVRITRTLPPPQVGGEYHRLLCMTGKNKGVSYYFINKRAVLGRFNDSDIQILDQEASREHAEIVRIGDHYILTDLNSQNGIILNDTKIKSEKLTDGDKVIIGQVVFQYNFYKIISEFNDNKNDKQEENHNNSDKTKNKKSLLYGLCFLLAFFLFFNEDEKIIVDKKIQKKALDTENDIFLNSLKKQKKQRKDNIDDQYTIVFDRGIREFREKNYFRAMQEFTIALRLKPSDDRSIFYLNKTKQKLDDEISENFLQARQSEDSLKYSKSLVSYCAILTLIRRYPEDVRFKKAKESIDIIKLKLGLREGDFTCFKKRSEKE